MWLTVKELSKYINIKEKTIYHLVTKGSIPHYRIGKMVRFKKQEIDAWMNSHKAKPLKQHTNKIIRSVYNQATGKPDRLGKGVSNVI
jgi:excisionase family DNA binding protein